MLSILIPTYNYNVYPLAKELHSQCTECDIVFEILVFDDGSKSKHNLINKKINYLDHTKFKELPQNIGRSAIRNLLASNAKYNYLLFIDAGTFPYSNKFIENYIMFKNKNVVCGGMTNLKKAPKKPFKLRWIYTKKRESNSLCSSNFLIKKEILLKFPFDQSIKTYGYEDVLFFNILKTNNFSIYSLNNPVTHNAEDDANTFIIKTEYAIENLLELIQKNKLNMKASKISKWFLSLNSLKLIKFTAKLFKLLKPGLVKNFNSSHPSLVLYDFYRLGYFCQLITKK
ncbi:glycosyltransferase family 2 protein [Snuella sedimenti]|uniref:Glycosyltransferase family 2 protein n=1 Tax=Snuella sedimenti TaxID=2798802 RepID=A0A8J7LTR4_9FLAO|nr:glycosyltransferase family A protein [Snuella sedimenti]MBJ6369300.1 glycosyltransferase family 2 protein [Snuella sedimenti]